MQAISEPSVAAQNVAMYSPRQIFLASFVGGPAAAAWFISRNYRALSRPERVRQSLVLGGVAMGALMLLVFLLPQKTPNNALPIVYSAAIYYYARKEFGSVVTSHLAAGGPKGSWWLVVGIALLSVVAFLGLVVAVALLFGALFPGALE